MKPCVYLLSNSVNSKVYVGKTVDAQHRWAQHISDSKRTPPRMLISRAIKKHGPENFTLSILEEFDSEEEALQAEPLWVSYHESNNLKKGYNQDSGGHGGKTLSDETRARLSSALKGKPKAPEHIAKVADALRGRKLPPETRAKMSLSKLGKKRDPEIGRKVSVALKGRALSPETQAKMAIARQGRKLSPEHVAKVAAANRGKKRSPEALLRMAVAQRERRAREAATQ